MICSQTLFRYPTHMIFLMKHNYMIDCIILLNNLLQTCHFTLKIHIISDDILQVIYK